MRPMPRPQVRAVLAGRLLSDARRLPTAQAPQNGRIDLDRPVGTKSELADYQAAHARAEAELAQVWERIEGLAGPEIDRLFAPPEKPKEGKPPEKRTTLAPGAG